YGFEGSERFDAARIAAQAVSGIGFLGAGIIFFQHGTIKGLTTAAGMWTTSAIGLAIGGGMYVIGIFSAILVYFIHSYLYKMFPYFAPRSSFGLLITFKRDGNLDVVNTTLKRTEYSHSENRISTDENGNWTVRTEITAHDQLNPSPVIEEFEKNPDVISVKIV
ncbi:MAG: MgtC/SapB family protein, partial [Erysipelotrichaceae bacterium]|nr:MgtC/SapB family protein [Erysipelotrichaceae bacterium]